MPCHVGGREPSVPHSVDSVGSVRGPKPCVGNVQGGACHPAYETPKFGGRWAGGGWQRKYPQDILVTGAEVAGGGWGDTGV